MVRVQTHPPMNPVDALFNATPQELGEAAVKGARLQQLVEKYKDRWFWCTLCRCASVGYLCCHGSTCNGGGCDKCDNTYEEVRELERENLAPTIDQIAGAREAQRKFDLDWYMRSKKSIEEEPEWFKRVQESFKYTDVPLMIPTEEEQKNWQPPTELWL